VSSDSEIIEIATVLANRVGYTNPLPPEAFVGGRNNRVFRLKTDEGTSLLKLYFHHPDDPRDRLGNEFGFLEHLQSSGSTLAAQPLAKEPASYAGLMEFIDGERLSIEQITVAEIEQVSTFFLEANEQRTSPLAQNLPHASEACFSIAEHLATTQRRVSLLDQIGDHDEVDASARALVADKLLPLWKKIQLRVESARMDLGLILPQVARVLSPSDFGFHNSLRESSGRLRFVDFEFAGWDDPAKLICDFRNQPDMLLDRSLTDSFTRTVIESNPEKDALEQRVSLLEPVYQLKWACICLNDFLDWGEHRKQFTGTDQSLLEIKTRQLAKASVMFERAELLIQH
jgi:hypothetical protein